MKVWELEEGKEYIVVDTYSTMACEKYRIKNGILESFSYGEWGGSSWDNRIDILKELNFTLYTPPTDWSKVEVDTKVLVSQDGSNWYNRHFAKYENGEIYAWCDGCTSFTYNSEEECDYDEEDAMTSWNYAKLYKQQ